MDGSYFISDIQDFFEHILKKHGKYIDNSSTKIHVNKIENGITLKLKNGYYPEFLILETMKLLGSTKNKKTKNKNAENVPHLESTEVVLVDCNIVNNDYSKIQEFCMHLFQIDHLVVYYKFLQKTISF